MRRRAFLKLLAASGAASALTGTESHASGERVKAAGTYAPARIVNEYSSFLPGERHERHTDCCL